MTHLVVKEDASIPLNRGYIEAFHEAVRETRHNELLVVELEGALVGMLQLTFIPYLTHIGSWRCLYEGVRIIVTIVDKVSVNRCSDTLYRTGKSKAVQSMQLTSDKQRPDAIRFYEKLGFKATHEKRVQTRAVGYLLITI